MHTHNTLDVATRQVRDTFLLGGDDVVFMASPIGHITAVMVAARLPVMYGMTAVWQEQWNAEAAAELIRREGCTFTLSATPFLDGLVQASNAKRGTGKRIRGLG